MIALVQTLLSHARLEDAKEAMDASPDLIDAGSRATWLGDIALREDKPADAVPQYARSLEHASRADDAIQAMNDSVGVAVGLLRAGFLEAGMEAAGALAARLGRDRTRRLRQLGRQLRFRRDRRDGSLRTRRRRGVRARAAGRSRPARPAHPRARARGDHSDSIAAAPRSLTGSTSVKAAGTSGRNQQRCGASRLGAQRRSDA